MLHELPMKNTLSCVQPIRAQNANNTASLPTNHVRAERLGSVSCSCFASVFFLPRLLFLYPASHAEKNRVQTSTPGSVRSGAKPVEQLCPAPACLPRRSLSVTLFLPNWNRLPPTSSERAKPIPGLRSRAVGGKEVAGSRDGERRGSRRAWRTGRTGAGVRLRFLQPGLHVSQRIEGVKKKIIVIVVTMRVFMLLIERTYLGG